MDTAVIIFDYATLDTETRIVLQQKTSEIRERMRRAAQDIVEIGERLIAAQERLAHGQWEAWLRAEFDWSDQTARRFMHVARAFEGKQQIVAFAPSALYALAAPSTPEAARQEALDRAGAGETITHTVAQKIIGQHRPESQIEQNGTTRQVAPLAAPPAPPIQEASDLDSAIAALRAYGWSVGTGRAAENEYGLRKDGDNQAYGTDADGVIASARLLSERPDLTPDALMEAVNALDGSQDAGPQGWRWAQRTENGTAHYWHNVNGVYWEARCGKTASREPPFRVIGQQCQACLAEIAVAERRQAGQEAASPDLPADITEREKAIALAAGYTWISSDLVAGKQATYRFESTAGVVDGMIITRPQFDAWLKIHTPPPCEDCGQASTNKRQIGGVVAHRCDACAALAECEDLQSRLGQQYRGAVERPDLGAGPWHRIAWARGGGGDYTYAQALERAARETAPGATRQGIDWDWIARRAHMLTTTRSEVEAWEQCRSIVACLAQGDRRAYAVYLLRMLAPLIQDVRPEGLEDLSAAIADLNECEEGTEGQHWIGVGWALLDVEPPESASAVPTLASEGIRA